MFSWRNKKINSIFPLKKGLTWSYAYLESPLKVWGGSSNKSPQDSCGGKIRKTKLNDHLVKSYVTMRNIDIPHVKHGKLRQVSASGQPKS